MRMFRDLLFLHGHVADTRLARELDTPPPHEPAPETPPETPPRSGADAFEKPPTDARACGLRPAGIVAP